MIDMTAHRLTHREQQVCDKLVRGLTNKEVAESLGISCRTVEDHRACILRKLKVRNTVELTRAVYGVEATT